MLHIKDVLAIGHMMFLVVNASSSNQPCAVSCAFLCYCAGMRRSRSAYNALSLEQLAADAQRMLQQTDRELQMSRQLSGGYNTATAVAAVGRGSGGVGGHVSYGRGIDIFEGIQMLDGSVLQQQQQQASRQPVSGGRSPLSGVPTTAAAPTTCTPLPGVPQCMLSAVPVSGVLVGGTSRGLSPAPAGGHMLPLFVASRVDK